MEQVLEHYGLTDQFKRSGDSLSGPCPIHKGNNPTQFRISIQKNVWNCFSECKHGGNALDFISRMENVSIHAAALMMLTGLHTPAHILSVANNEWGFHTQPTRKLGGKTLARSVIYRMFTHGRRGAASIRFPSEGRARCAPAA
jgi:hypothetical protein